MDNSIPVFPSFDYDADKSNAGPRWEKWIKRLEILFDAMNIDADKRKRALLLYYAGERVTDIYEVEREDTSDSYISTKSVLSNYFAPKRNIQMAIYDFRNYKQKSDQTLDEFVTELRQLARNCDFTDIEKEILSQVIQHCSSTRLRRRALRETDKTLKDILEMGRALEMADKQASAMERDTTNTINSVQKQQQKFSHSKQKYVQHNKDQRKQNKKCIFCAGDYPHKGKCPALGKTCLYCKKKNHFKIACLKLTKKQTVNEIHENTEIQQRNLVSEPINSSDDEYCYSVKHFLNMIENKTPVTTIKLNNVSVMFKIDTGASVNIIDEYTHQLIGSPPLSCRRLLRLYAYNKNEPLPVLGSCLLKVQSISCIQSHVFHVVKGKGESLLGSDTSQQLQLVRIINSITSDIQTKYPSLCTGIGKLKNVKVKIHIDENIAPVTMRHRRTPFHLREKVDKELQELLNNDIIEKVEGKPTPWVSPIVTPPKKDPNKIRICVDMRAPNKAILRERHQMPTLDEIITDLNGATTFSKLDLRSGYHQLELDESSRYITTFATHKGLFQYKRLNFGISSAAEIFQETIHNIIQDIPGTKNISDDIIIFGKTVAEHDKALNETLKKLNDCGLSLNINKCDFNKNKIDFFGLIFSSSGISPDPQKIKAIAKLCPPQNPAEVKSFLGMMNYCSRFIPDYSTLSEPLRRLTREKSKWEWTDLQQEAFLKLKEAISRQPVMAYFKPNQPIEIWVDASPCGVGAVLTQEHGVIAFASRALTDVESRYSQTEREALAIVWACEHFDIYVNGAKHFTVITDHKPLVNIWQKSRPPLRIERWGLRLQPYKYSIKYRPGSQNPADYMSRHPSVIHSEEKTNTFTKEQYLAEHYVNFITQSSVPNAMNLEEIRRSTLDDKTLQKVIEYMNNGRWFEINTISNPDINIDELHDFKSVRDELTCHIDGVILRDSRIIIPEKLRDKAIQLAHEGHQGMNRTKAFIRSKVWFPGINERVETKINSCLACLATYSKPPRLEPLRMSEMPDGPWQNLSADFCGPLPSGHYFLVIIDEYSRYPIVEILKSTSAHSVIPVFDKVLSEFGIPRIIKTDNGSPFNSNDFTHFANYCGFEHRKITPRWPRANAQAEAFNKPLMKAVRSARIDNLSWKQVIFKFLRQYRSTPHPSTGFTPFRLLFGREPKTRLPNPSITPNHIITDHRARLKDRISKEKMKSYADNRNHAEIRDLGIGDNVLVKSEKRNKLSTPFDIEPFMITAKKGNMITASNNNNLITRNSSCFKKIPDHVKTTVSLEEEEEESLYQQPITQPVTQPVKQPVKQPSVKQRPIRKCQPPSRYRDFAKI